VRQGAATIALTTSDAARLTELSGAPDRVHRVPAPFPSRLPPAETPLPGSPAVVLFGSEGWRPNREGARWFVEAVWPRVRAALPQAVLHVLGPPVGSAAGVRTRPAPIDSREAFARGAVLVVPLHVAAGVRMKILEAWARGVPVVATPEAAQGLDVISGQELLLAAEAEAFAAALCRLHGEPDLAPALVAAGRDRLAAHHEPAAVAARLVEVYTAVVPAAGG
jgi:glycosyltransferase involved in cell wall biosynthesis